MADQEPKVGDSSGDVTPTPPVPTPPNLTPPSPTPVPPTAKVEIVDGRVQVDGKKYILESDLMAAKNSLEGKMEQAQTAHNTAIDAARLEMSTAQQQIATLNAKIKETETARQTGAVSDDEAARVKQELETTKSSLETTQAKSLEYRRELITKQHPGAVSLENLKDKTPEQLDALEEALKVVSNSSSRKGPGNYATGIATGEPAPQTNMERATKILEATPERGVRANVSG